MKHTVTEVKLKNGAQGLFINVPSATVMVYEVNFAAGDYFSPNGKWDVAHLTEHLVLAANEAIRNGRLFNAELEKNGASTNAYTSPEYITYWAECADLEWQRILELLLTAVSKPVFLREEYRAEYGNIKDELTARTNNHFGHLDQELYKALGLFAATDRDRLKELRNIRRIDVLNHYKKTHTSRNMRFMVAGNLRGRRATIEKIFEGISLPKGRKRFELPKETPKNIGKPLYISRPSVKNTHFFLDSFSLKWLDDKHRDALFLVNNMLTSTLHSRILGEARQRGLVYHLSSSLSRNRGHAVWWYGSQIIPKNAPALFEIIVREILRVKAGEITTQDLDAAKQYAIGRYQRSGQTVSGVLHGYSGRYYFDGVIEDYNSFPDQVKAVTAPLAVEAVNRMFSDKVGGLGLLGNGKTRELAEPLYEMIQALWV